MNIYSNQQYRDANLNVNVQNNDDQEFGNPTTNTKLGGPGKTKGKKKKGIKRLEQINYNIFNERII